MKKGWQTKKLGDLCVLTSGGTPSKSNPRFWVGDVPFVSARDLKSDRIETALLHISREAVEKSAAKLAPVGSLLMLVRGMGLANGIQVGEVTASVAFNQDIRALHPPLDSVLPRFLLLALRNGFINGDGQRVLSSAAHGTLKIDTDVLREIAVPLPSLPEQQRIVGILDEAFESIAIAEANTERNQKSARTLFSSTLTAALRDERNGWGSRKLESLLLEGRNISYGIVKPGRPDPKGVRLIKSQQVRDDAMDLSVDFRITKELDQEYARTRLQGGEILLNLVGASIGRSAIAPKALRGANVSRAISVIPVLPELAPWIQYNLRGSVGQKLIQSKTGGSAQPVLNLSEVKSLTIPFPPFDEQRAIIGKLDDVAKETQRLAGLYERKLGALEALKMSLLHQAFTGNL
jgi:type I restriction enzyme S subunit